jgi:vacuolar-type H+-ATPase subunit I/STV1
MKEEILKKLNLHEVKKSKVESDLGMPKNSLSAMLSGKKEIPSKWVKPLTEYIEKLDNPNQPQKEAKQEPETEKAVESTQNELKSVNKDYKPAFIEREVIDKLVAKYDNPVTALKDYTQNNIKDFEYEKIEAITGDLTILIKEKNLDVKLSGDANSKFDQLLKQFNSLVDLTDKPKDIKLKLEQIKETSKNSNLTPRQTDAIIDRCNNQLENKYNTSKHSLKLS